VSDENKQGKGRPRLAKMTGHSRKAVSRAKIKAISSKEHITLRTSTSNYLYLLFFLHYFDLRRLLYVGLYLQQHRGPCCSVVARIVFKRVFLTARFHLRSKKQ
jgi:hypothetical protein